MEQIEKAKLVVDLYSRVEKISAVLSKDVDDGIYVSVGLFRIRGSEFVRVSKESADKILDILREELDSVTKELSEHVK